MSILLFGEFCAVVWEKRPVTLLYTLPRLSGALRLVYFLPM